MRMEYWNAETFSEKKWAERKPGAYGGKRWLTFLPTCEEDGYTALARERGFFLIFSGLEPKAEFFPVPALAVFARDRWGGFFACGTEKEFHKEKIYYITPTLACYFVAEEFRSLVWMMIFEPDWRKETGMETEMLEETPAEKKALGKLFGLTEPEQPLADNIRQAEGIAIFESLEAAKKQCVIHSTCMKSNEKG